MRGHQPEGPTGQNSSVEGFGHWGPTNSKEYEIIFPGNTYDQILRIKTSSNLHAFAQNSKYKDTHIKENQNTMEKKTSLFWMHKPVI